MTQPLPNQLVGHGHRHKLLARDVGLDKLSKATSAVVGATIGAIGVATIFVASSLPGRSVPQSSQTASSTGQVPSGVVNGATPSTLASPNASQSSPGLSGQGSGTPSQGLGSGSPNGSSSSSGSLGQGSSGQTPATLSPPVTAPVRTYRAPVILSSSSSF